MGKGRRRGGMGSEGGEGMGEFTITMRHAGYAAYTHSVRTVFHSEILVSIEQEHKHLSSNTYVLNILLRLLHSGRFFIHHARRISNLFPRANFSTLQLRSHRRQFHRQSLSVTSHDC